jgi:rare lipoprotein A (peptidoglycan hydrolase)
MTRGNATGGTIKRRTSNRPVDIYKTMPVVSTALFQRCCALICWYASRAGNSYPPRRGWIRKYSSLAGLTACSVLILHPGTACAQPRHKSVIQTGTASYYGKAHQGRRTASGQRFDDTLLTAAHPWLPLGTKVRVTLLGTGRSVVVKINDRMPARRRMIDLSLAAARELGIVHRGIARVELTSR